MEVDRVAAELSLAELLDLDRLIPHEQLPPLPNLDRPKRLGPGNGAIDCDAQAV
jgi:hypothetical protein